jgi:serpin B
MAVLIPQSHLQFGSRLLQQLLRRKEENVFVSPASISLALGMAASGARGKTLAAIEQALGVDAQLAMNRSTRLFASFDTLPPGLVVEIANALWAASGLPLSPRYTAAVRESYRAEVRSLDFTMSGASQVVNDWVAHVTHGQITSAVDQLDPSSILALVNATYFNGLWEDPFDPEDPFDWEFTTGSRRAIGVQLMERSALFDYMEDSDLQAVQVPYKKRRFSLLVVLPRKPLLTAAFHEIAAPSFLARILAGLRPKDGTLRLPKVGLDYAADLMPELLEMGMGPAFSEDADFSGIFEGGVRAYISTVSHKTRLEIDEKGTTAAASTVFGVVMGLSDPGMPPPPFNMTVDRPFLVAVIESETDMILFLGIVGNPNP